MCRMEEFGMLKVALPNPMENADEFTWDFKGGEMLISILAVWFYFTLRKQSIDHFCILKGR